MGVYEIVQIIVERYRNRNIKTDPKQLQTTDLFSVRVPTEVEQVELVLMSAFRDKFGCALVITCNGCYTKYQQCYATFSSVPSPTDNDNAEYCKAADKGMKCLMDDAKDCPKDKRQPDIYKNFKTAMASIQNSCKQAKCGLDQQKCSKKALEAYNMVPKDGSKLDKKDVPKFCSGMKDGLNCYEKVMKDCPSIAEPLKQNVKQFGQMKELYCKDYDNSASVSVCSMVVMVLAVLGTLL
ncbi:hypothetical protein LOTGIDRAFT_228269 [Lottia gigantea]|uniref:Uncharacterized protein n=1 Tax=Lottia gigantea TaxID=225164 RepID=V4A1E9_LOTGI|nr:hypothetical protein LOTGIDRAFT_228269 [Lottia gigantea]ESO97648.1 hypothetical protein LOTGIDRAFT_228269 [Lottia gigantea]